MKIIRFFPFLLILVFLVGCGGAKPVIPEYDDALDQYLFAKRLREQMFIQKIEEKNKEARDDAVIMAFENVMQRFPADEKVTPLAMIDLADIYMSQKKYRKAIDLYEKALMKYPDQDDIVCKSFYGAARGYDEIENYERALSYYKQCYEKFENHPMPHIAALASKAKFYYNRIRMP